MLSILKNVSHDDQCLVFLSRSENILHVPYSCEVIHLWTGVGDFGRGGGRGEERHNRDFFRLISMLNRNTKTVNPISDIDTSKEYFDWL